MKIVAMLRVKDGILFINDWLERISQIVDEIVVVDNGSTDGTFEVIKMNPKVVEVKRTEGFHEGRDKILAYELVKKRKADWCLWLDVDEFFEDRFTRKNLELLLKNDKYTKFRFRLYNFHKDYKHFEAGIDKLLAISIPIMRLWKVQKDSFFKNLMIHNGSIQNIKGKTRITKYRIKHFGAVNKNYLKRKTYQYITIDDNEQRKKMYIRHMYQEVKVWKWYEYHESPTKVFLQNTFINIILVYRYILKLIT